MMVTTLEILKAIEAKHGKFKRAEVIENGVVDTLYYLRRGLARRVRTERNKIYREDIPGDDDIKATDLCISYTNPDHKQRHVEVKEKTGFVLTDSNKLATGLNKSEFMDFVKLLPYGEVSLIFYHHPDGKIYKRDEQSPYDITIEPIPSGLFEIDLMAIQKWSEIDIRYGGGDILCWCINRFKQIMTYDDFNRFLDLEKYNDLL